MERRLVGNEPKLSECNGNPFKFSSFCEHPTQTTFEELSVLLICCKRDVARALRMIASTGDSCENAVRQLKTQFEDTKRSAMEMVRQPKSMKQCRVEPRSPRYHVNNCKDEKPGETVCTAHLISIVLDNFPKSVQDEMSLTH